MNHQNGANNTGLNWPDQNAFTQQQHTHQYPNEQQVQTSATQQEPLTPVSDEPAAQQTNFSDENVYREPTKWSERQVPLVILACSESDLRRINEGVKERGLTETTEGLEWLYYFTNGLQTSLNSAFGSKALSDPDRFFTKRVKSPLGPTIGPKNIGVDNVSENLSPASAKHLVRSLIGSGTTRRWPLFRSGFWVTLTTPEEDELLVLDDRIAEEKTALGAKTAGLAFSVSMSYIFKHVCGLIATSLVQTNIDDPDFNKADIFQYVRLVDVWGLVGFYASLIYPNGYAARIPCTADNECSHSDAVYIDILDLLRVDRSQLTEEQILWMADPKQTRTLKEINEYQTKYNVSDSVELEVEDTGLAAGTIIYEIPTVEQYLSSSEMWIDEIANRVEATISDKTTLKRKESLMEDTFRLSLCREYGHCIQRIVLPAKEFEDGVVRKERDIRDRISINALLSEYSTNPEFTKQIIRNISDFLDRRTITHVGIPPHTCTKCHQVSSRPVDVNKPVTLIPLDPVTTFFTLRSQKLQRSMLAKAQG